MKDCNPLTGLPGNRSIHKILKKLVTGRKGTAAYIDIIDFKPFNDYYGFALGDSVIRRLGHILVESLPLHFVGHIGGDDFICIGEGQDFLHGVDNARQRFRSIVPGFYTTRDRELGGIETFDREGSYRFIPLLDISVVLTDMSTGDLTVESLAEKAGREKKLLKGEQIPEPVFPVLEKAIEAEYPIAHIKALIEACGVLREEGAVSLLAEIIGGNYSWNLRKSAALSLGHIANPRCIELLLDALEDSNPHVRTRAVEGLVISLGKESGKSILPMLQDKSTWVRRAVLRGLGYSGWNESLPHLRSMAIHIAPGRSINTKMERKAALEGISLLGLSGESEFLFRLCRTKDYFPVESAFNALCSVGTDFAAEEVIRRKVGIPVILNLTGISLSNLRKLESIAVKSLSGDDKEVSAALRFFEGFSPDLLAGTSSELKNCLGDFSGDRFRRLVLLLDKRKIAADRSCIARVASRIDSGEQIGTSALSAFLGWVSRRGGVHPASLLKSFLRGDRRALAASAALAVRSLASRDLTRMKNGETIS